MKDAAPASKFPFLRSVVADVRPSLFQTPEAAFGLGAIEAAELRHNPLASPNAGRAVSIGEPGITPDAANKLERGPVTEPVAPEMNLRPAPASIKVSTTDTSVPPTLTSADRDGLGREPDADAVGELPASVPDEPSTAVRPVRDDEIGLHRERRHQPAELTKSAWSIDHAVPGDIPATAQASRLDGAASDRKQDVVWPGPRPALAPASDLAPAKITPMRVTPRKLASSSEQREQASLKNEGMEGPPSLQVFEPARGFSENYDAKRIQAKPRPGIGGAQPAEGSMLPPAESPERDAPLDPAFSIERAEALPEKRWERRTPALAPTRAALRAQPLRTGRNERAESAGNPDVHIGHVDITVVSTDPAPEKPRRPAASPPPASSLASLHYLRRF